MLRRRWCRLRSGCGLRSEFGLPHCSLYCVIWRWLTGGVCVSLLLWFRYQYPVQHMEGVPLPPGIPGLGGSTDPLEAVLGPFPCARLRNLPYDASIEDILALFQGLVVIDAVLVGQGEAFVIFANPMDFQMALQRWVRRLFRFFVASRLSHREVKQRYGHDTFEWLAF